MQQTDFLNYLLRCHSVASTVVSMHKRALTCTAIASLFAITSFTPPANATSEELRIEYTDSNSSTAEIVGTDKESKLWESELEGATGDLKEPQEVSSTIKSTNTTFNQEAISKVYFRTDSDGIIEDRVFASARTGSVDSDTGRTPLQWSVSSSGVDLAWWTPDGDVEWTVSRNGVEVSRTTGTTFRDTEADSSKNQQYTVTATHEYTDPEGESQEEAYHYGVNTPPVDDSAVGLAITDSEVQTPELNTDIAGYALTSSGMRDTQVAYGTFIPDKRIDRPSMCTPVKYEEFGGDNRTFASDKAGDFHELSNRMQNIAFLAWDGNTAGLDEAQANVGTTRAYIDGKQVASKTASSSGIKTFLTPVPSRALANIKFQQAGSDPLCNVLGAAPAPDINAVIDVSLKNGSGAMHITGEHDGAPNHELVFNHISPKGKFYQGCGYRFQRGKFTSLLPPMEINVDVTMNPTGNWLTSCPIYEKS